MARVHFSTDGLHIAALAINGTYIYEWIPAQYNTYKEKYFICTIFKQKIFGNISKRVQSEGIFFWGGGVQCKYNIYYATNLNCTKSIRYVT